MSSNAPHMTICVGSADQIRTGIQLLNMLLDNQASTQAPTLDTFDPPPNPNNASTAAETQPEEQLSPQQKAARTRAANKAKRDAEAAQQAGAPASMAITPDVQTPAAPITPSAPAVPQPAVAAPAPVTGPVDYAAMSQEASQIHARLGMEGRQQALIDTLTQFGVARLDALPQEQWGDFLNAIRVL